jgi:CheY-like chemotaxis protein
MAKPKQILVAEDEETDVFFLRYAFEKAGLPHCLTVVHDGQQAIDYLSGQGPYFDRAQYPLPALMLLDLKMPRLTGFDVLSWLQNHSELKTVIAVVLTSSPNETDRQHAQELGAAEYFVKPDSVQGLTDVVKKLQARWLDS